MNTENTNLAQSITKDISAQDISAQEIEQRMAQTLAAQRAAYLAHPVPDYAERIADLDRLAQFVREHKEAICDAINQDFGNRSRHETLLSEILPTLNEIHHSKKHLKQWMKPQRRAVDLKSFFGAKNRVIPQPLGVVGVIVPWNFPLFLSLGPLIGVFAAGNRAMVKMSENSRHLTRLLQDKLANYFPPEKLCFFEGEEGAGQAFSKQPFDHLIFTGSGQTGSAVMAAAARNLCPVTLELGGKSPAIILDDFDFKLAVERIMYAKCLNAGQICVTVDHVYVPAHKVEEFIQIARAIVQQRYTGKNSVDYTAIIDGKSFDRLTQALDEAKSAGTRVIPVFDGEALDASARKMAPHLLINPPMDIELMTREIFGPILPVIPYTDLSAVVKDINSRPRPLAFYPFTHDGKKRDYLLNHVISGGVSVNDTLLHVAQTDMPFGGVGASGMGHYHGYEGFLTFSKLRPVFYQARWSAASLLAPPYGKTFDRIMNFLMK